MSWCRNLVVTYWVTQKLPQICTVILRILIGKVAWFAVYICGNFWVTQYVDIMYQFLHGRIKGSVIGPGETPHAAIKGVRPLIVNEQLPSVWTPFVDRPWDQKLVWGCLGGDSMWYVFYTYYMFYYPKYTYWTQLNWIDHMIVVQPVEKYEQRKSLWRENIFFAPK